MVVGVCRERRVVAAPCSGVWMAVPSAGDTGSPVHLPIVLWSMEVFTLSYLWHHVGESGDGGLKKQKSLQSVYSSLLVHHRIAQLLIRLHESRLDGLSLLSLPWPLFRWPQHLTHCSPCSLLLAFYIHSGYLLSTSLPCSSV